MKLEPYAIQLSYDGTEYTQPISLGVDAASKTIGISATMKKEELYAAEVKLRTDIVDLLSTRRAFRSARRNRKTRCRKPRFSNRVRSKHKGWLAPSIESKIQTHIKTVSNVHKILPIAKIVVEAASFDIQKIKNPGISGAECQQGGKLGFWNVREYVLLRDGHACHGRKGCKNPILNVHHLGGDAPNNPAALCGDCRNDYRDAAFMGIGMPLSWASGCRFRHHEGKLKLDLKRGQSFRDAAFMGIMRWAFYNKSIRTHA
ncbi:MAG: RRXRR domain-containing protein [Clostridiales bacterium]|nr:RRXRR domain-containing protein [Clostridiales bacterium]